MKKIITVLLVAAIAATSAAALTACGSSDKADPTTAATVASTTAATTAATQADQQSANAADSQSVSSTADSGNSSSDSDTITYSEGEYAGITEQAAYSSALERAPAGSKVIDCYQGSEPSQGWDAWVVTVQQPDGTEQVYYCGFPFCFTADSFGDADMDTEEEGFTEGEAIANVLQRAEDEATVIDSYKGTTPGGLDCYIVTVENADGSQQVFYSGLLFCYPAE